jgi:DNA-binding transcriptional LysR family regulator
MNGTIAVKHLNDMPLFVEVVKAMSFRRAAESLGMPGSTLSRRISDLEKTIGLRLLHRTTRKIELTEAGRVYFECCRRIVEDARLVHEQLGEMLSEPSGVLRVSLPVDFGICLTPLIVEFGRRHPAIRFEFDLTPRQIDLVSESVDMVIRIGEPPPSSLVARLLVSLPGHLYASPRYLERMGAPRVPADLTRHECLCFSAAPGNGTWTLHRGAQHHATETVEIMVDGRFRLNNIGMMRRLAALDMGIAIFAQEIIGEELSSGQLRRVLPEWQTDAIPVYAITETRLLPAKTQRFIEFLRERLGQKAEPEHYGHSHTRI